MTLIMLSAYLNDRWARDGLTADQACEATLSPADVYQITGRRTLHSGRITLQSLASLVSMSIKFQGGFTTIKWPKYAEFQGMRVHEGTKKVPHAVRSTQYAIRSTQEDQQDASHLASDARSLANLLAPYPGTREQKIEWLLLNLTLLHLEVEKEGLPTKKRQNASLKSMAIRWYRYQTDPKRKDRATGRVFESFTEQQSRSNKEWYDNLIKEISGGQPSPIPSDV